MQALTSQTLKENAYRTLGLSGRAGRAEIEQAMARRRDASAAHLASDWDLPFLGWILRGPMEIESAAARLHDPALRAEERLSNQDFLAKAPAHVIEGGRTRLAEMRERQTSLRASLGEG